MKQFILALSFVALTVPAVAKTHKDTYPVTCEKLWPSVKSVLKTDRYKIISIDSNDMMASFGVGNWYATTVNTVSLNPTGTSCTMSVNSTFRGLAHNDAADFKTRVDADFKTRADATIGAQTIAPPVKNGQ